MTLPENDDEFPPAGSRPAQILPVQATSQDATAWLRTCGVIAAGVQAGEMIPDFELVNAAGVAVSLGSLLDHGPAVITFIPGSRSRVCRSSLRSLQNVLPQIETHAGTLVAISPDPPNASGGVAAEDGLGFDLLTDDHHQLGRLFGLTYRPPAPIAVWSDLLDVDPVEDWMTSDWVLPATYVVDTSGIATYAFLDPDPTRRVDPRAVVESLARMASKSAVHPG